MTASKPGFGVVGTLDLDTVRLIAERAEAIGLHSLWFNETPEGDALARIEVAASASTRLVMGTGVINLDRTAPRDIVAAIRRRGLPQERLIVGVGASSPPSPLGTVRNALGILTAELDCPVVVGSLGPRMRKLGAEEANGLLFNWLTPRFARETTDTMRKQAGAAGNEPVVAATYIRTALGRSALSRLEDEAARYSRIPSYAANFDRLGISAMESAVYGEKPETIRSGIAAFDGTVDLAIVRAITPTDDVEHYLALLDAIAPLTS